MAIACSTRENKNARRDHGSRRALPQAGELGFEPRQADPESAVLPLHHSPSGVQTQVEPNSLPILAAAQRPDKCFQSLVRPDWLGAARATPATLHACRGTWDTSCIRG